jgi:hypothetical protein
MLLNPILMTLCLVLLLGFGTYTAFASSSDDDEDDEDSQDEESSQNGQPQQLQPNQPPQVTWKTFKDRESLFTVQYPSNWTPQGVVEAERAGPIDILFFSPGATNDADADIEFSQWAQPSVFGTPKEALEQEIIDLQNDPTVTKFEIESPIECSKYTLNGLPACSIIYEINSAEGGPLAIMIVDALAPNGTEYEVYYRSDFNLFKHFLPVIEYMIKSFQTTGSTASTSDFSLSNSGSPNATGQQSTRPSSEDDFSLG